MIGVFENNEIVTGTSEYPNGTYTGYFKDYMKNGKGRFVMKDDTHIEGTFENDVIIGECFIGFPNGDTFEGTSEAMTFLIKGKYHRLDGVIFEGTFE